MSAGRTLVCGVDGSIGSRRAAASAARLSRQLHRGLVLVHVIPPRPPMPLASIPVGAHPVATSHMQELDRLEADAAFASIQDEVSGTDAERITEHGNPADRLSAVADTRDADLIVVGTRGAGPARAALLGSVSQELAARGSRPVVIVPDLDPPAPDGPLAPGPVVCGVDGSEAARDAARVALCLADGLHAALTLVSVHTRHAAGDDTADALAAMAADAPVRDQVERLATIGDPADALARTATKRRAALLVVGSRGRGPVRAALLGSVSATVTRLAPCPVVIVPPATAAA